MNANKQRGSTVIGVILGVLIGLGVALGVAIYVMKVPTPFNNKSTSRTPSQDAAEAKKNKDWDPNAGLSKKPAVKPTDSAAEPAAKPAPAAAPQAPAATTPAPASPVATTPAADGVEYYVQVGAFRSNEEAQALRGKLALSNFEGKIVEREQSGQKVYRVRVGPFANQAAGDKAKASLDAVGFDTIVVRAQR
jgi:cell division protein FtsN